MLALASAFVSGHCPFERIHRVGDFALFDAHGSNAVPQKAGGTLSANGFGQFERLAVILSRFLPPLLSSPQVTEEIEKPQPLLCSGHRKSVVCFIHQPLCLPQPARLNVDDQEI